MPELPDVEGFKRYLDATSLHQKIEKTVVNHERVLKDMAPQKLGRRLKGASLEEAQRHGKFLFARLSSEEFLALHFGMTGYLSYYEDSDEEPRHTRVRFDFENGHHLAYINQRLLGQVRVVENAEAFIEEQEMGPDAMSEELTPETFAQRMKGKRGTIKSLLMNQNWMAGIGNVYSDEILFHAGLHPQTKVDRIDKSTARELFRVMRRVLNVCNKAAGDVSQLPDDYLLPHRDADEQCPRCGNSLVKKKVSGRTCHICKNCQKQL